MAPVRPCRRLGNGSNQQTPSGWTQRNAALGKRALSATQQQPPVIRLDEVEASGRTGDVLLFEGNRPELRLMQKVERSRWSHVGMLVRIPETGQLIIWESEPMGVIEDVITHQRKSGPQGVPFLSRVRSSEGDAAALGYRRLDPPLTDEHHDRLRTFVMSVYHLPFPIPNHGVSVADSLAALDRLFTAACISPRNFMPEAAMKC